MARFRIKKVSPKGQMPHYYAQYLNANKWTTIYLHKDGETFLLFDPDTKSIDCRFRTSEQAELRCREYLYSIEPPSDVSYTELDL